MTARHALVTGAASGIGAAIAARLLGDGWRVTGLDRAPATIAAAGYAHRQADLAEGASLRAAIASLDDVTALVHAAGIMRPAPLGALDHAGAEAMWRIHVAAAALLGDLLAPRLPTGGRILLIGSRAAGGQRGRSAYAASKAALVGLARSWAAELIGRGITVNVIAPAATDTAMLRDPARAATTPILPPIGRLIAPEEVAALAGFLLSAEAGAITGQSISVCGGASL